MLAQEMYVAAEVDYRRERGPRAFGRPQGARHSVRRRPVLHLPRPRRRPLSLA
jgi:hypothetical protein